eukprot:2794021-Rhodomonas_salina.1
MSNACAHLQDCKYTVYPVLVPGPTAHCKKMATLVPVLPGYPGKTAVSPGPEPMLPNMPCNDFDGTAIAIRRTHYR